MADGGQRKAFNIKMDERNLSIIVHSLFSSWMLAFLFEGQILYALTAAFDLDPYAIVFSGIASLIAGTLLCGFSIKTKKAAKQLFLCSFLFFIVTSAVFFFPPSIFWNLGIAICSFLAGGCVAAWGYYLKSGTPKNERIKTIADMLIASNILMILLNMVAIHISPYVAFILSILMLVGAFVFALKLPVNNNTVSTIPHKKKEDSFKITGILVFLCMFIAIITINSGLMYQIVNPAFAHLEWLTSLYWAIPYIVALFIMRNLSPRINRTYILFLAIAMIGISFILFMVMDRSVVSYLVVNMLMLGACGVYDLFWWSILGEMLEFNKNPAKVLGIGLSANLMGILLGGFIGKVVTSSDMNNLNPVLLALLVVCVSSALLLPLHKHLSTLLKGHIYLTEFLEMPTYEQTVQINRAKKFLNLSERESQVATLLLQGKTYKTIAAELFISENTVKYYVKNIYAKFNIQSRAELIEVMMKN